MGDNLERMKKAAKGPPPAGKIIPPQGGSGTAPPKPKAGPKGGTGTPPPGGDVRVTHRCGHAFTAYDLSQHDCLACSRKTGAKKAREKRAKMGKLDFPPTQRLPAGSAKVLVWDGTVWSGTLSVPGIDAPFEFQADSERKCYHGLHNAYVAWQGTQTFGGTDGTPGQPA